MYNATVDMNETHHDTPDFNHIASTILTLFSRRSQPIRRKLHGRLVYLALGCAPSPCRKLGFTLFVNLYFVCRQPVVPDNAATMLVQSDEFIEYRTWPPPWKKNLPTCRPYLTTE